MMNFEGKKSIGRRQYASGVKDTGDFGSSRKRNGSAHKNNVTSKRDQKDF